LSPNTAKTLQRGTIMRDLSMDALKKAAAEQQKSERASEAPKKEAAKAPEPAKRKDPGVPLSFDLPPGSSAMLTDLKAARQRSSEDPDAADMERYATAERLISDLRAHGIEFWTTGGEVHYRPASILSDYAKSELERVKSELYEILREEEREAWWETTLAAQPEMDPMPADEYDEFCRLGLLPEDEDDETKDEPDEELINARQDTLIRWISETLVIDPDLKPSSYRTSYHLKHVLEESPEGFYVTDEQFRAAMWLCGFLGRRVPGPRNKDIGTRYYYVRPNREGFVEKLVRCAGVPQGWAREAIRGQTRRYQGRSCN
jgi:hypothetical protein